MNSLDRERASRLYKLVMGRSARDSDLARLMESASTYDEFRILLVSDSDRLPSATQIIGNWKRQTRRKTTAPDANELMHQLEHLTQRQKQLETELRRSDAEMLDRLSQIDSLAGKLLALRNDAHSINVAISRHRDAILNLARSEEGSNV